MASLACRNSKEITSLSIVRVPAATGREDASDYYVEVREAIGDTGLTCRFALAGYRSNVDDLWRLARAFAESPKLVGLARPLRSNSVARIFASVSCMDAVIIAPGHRPEVVANLYVKEDASPDLFRHFFIKAGASETLAFGEQLEREIIQASPKWAAARNLSVQANIMD